MARAKPKTRKAVSAKAVPSSTKAMAKQLALILSDAYVLGVKIHGYHWNVVGRGFGALHSAFEEMYKHLIVEISDDIAERIRALGMMPDGSMDAFLQNTVIKEAGPKALSSEEMLKDMLKSYKQLRERVVKAEALADKQKDLVTQDMMIGLMADLDKTIWMVHSHLL